MIGDRPAVVAGIGATEFSRDSGRTELRLAVECVRAALADAGMRPADLSGLVTATSSTVGENELAAALGVDELTFFARVPFGGGGACASVGLAAMAVATGRADVVVCYRAINQVSDRRRPSTGHGMAVDRARATAEDVHWGWYAPFGLRRPAAFAAMFAQRYLHEFGASTDDFGRVTVSARRYAATNPAAYFHRRPISLDDHRASRWVARPLRILDCCLESDGAVAVVVTRADRATDLPARAVRISASAQGCGPDQQVFTGYYRDSLTELPELAVVAGQLWRQACLGPADIDCAILYDHFTPFVLMQLEELGFCPRGQAPAFVAEGGIDRGGRLPVNPNGGQLGEAYVQGLNGIAEAVRQVRGSAVNQVAGAANVLVTAGTSIPSSGLVLTRHE